MEWTLNYRRANPCGSHRPSIESEAPVLLDTNVVSDGLKLATRNVRDFEGSGIAVQETTNFRDSFVWTRLQLRYG